MTSVLLLSGPNLNLLGDREPDIYGTDTLDDLVARAGKVAEVEGLELEHVFSNDEAVLVEAIQNARRVHGAIIINAAALTHYSWSIHDALCAFDGVIVELHLSNPHRREPFRHVSVIADVAHVIIAGAGGLGYELAVHAAADHLRRR